MFGRKKININNEIKEYDFTLESAEEKLAASRNFFYPFRGA